jgi:hypothetical protein
VLIILPIRSSSPKPTSLKPTANIPACTANATASVVFFSCGPSPFGSDVAMNNAMEPAQSGLPVVLSCTMVTFCWVCSCLKRISFMLVACASFSLLWVSCTGRARLVKAKEMS